MELIFFRWLLSILRLEIDTPMSTSVFYADKPELIHVRNLVHPDISLFLSRTPFSIDLTGKFAPKY